MMRIPVSRLFSTVAMAIGLLAANVAAASPYSGFQFSATALGQRQHLRYDQRQPAALTLLQRTLLERSDLRKTWRAPRLCRRTVTARRAPTMPSAAHCGRARRWRSRRQATRSPDVPRETRHAADSSALYVVWAGGNDLRALT